MDCDWCFSISSKRGHHWGTNTFAGLFTDPQFLVFWNLEYFCRGAVLTTHFVNAPVPLNILASNPWSAYGHKTAIKLEIMHTNTRQKEEVRGGKNFHRILNNTAAASWILHLQRGEGCSAEDNAWQEQATATFPHLAFPTTFLIAQISAVFSRECHCSASVCSGLYPLFFCRSGKSRHELKFPAGFCLTPACV